MFKKFLGFVADLFFPKFCIGCNTEGFWICPSCFGKIKFSDNFSCPVCEKILPEGKICDSCRSKTKLSRFFATASYENKLIKDAIRKLKYDFVKDICRCFSGPIINFLKSLNLDFSEFLIVPVSLHKSRLRWRGFNQAEEIAKIISESLNIPIKLNSLEKTKNTPPQVEINDYQKRRENIQGAFGIKNPELLKNKKIILIDDVYTTGSTMEECAKILKRAGAKEIWGIVVAR